jgi:hypothetical protein
VSAVGHLRPFTLHLLGDSLDLLTISFGGARFKSMPGTGVKFETKITDVRTGALLDFLSELQGVLDSGDGNGIYHHLRFAPLTLEVGYQYSQSLIMLGNLQLINLAVLVGASLPLDDRQAEFFAALSSRERPFLIAAPPYGGGGFFGLRATAHGIISFEIQFEFGFVGAWEMGPLKAQARATVGVYLQQGGGTRVLEGFFHACGEGHLACFGISVDIELRMRQEEDGAMAGSATYSYSFKVGFFKVHFEVQTGHRQENGRSGGGAPPSHGVLLADGAGEKISPACDTQKATHLPDAWTSYPPMLRSATADKQTEWKTYRQHIEI